MTIEVTAEGGHNGIPLRVHGGDGKMRRTLSSVQRAAKAAELYSIGWTFQQIADELGWKHRTHAKRAVDKCLAEVQAQSVENLRKRQDALLDRLLRKAIEVMDRDHVAHSQGRIVRGGCSGPASHEGCTNGVPGAPYCDGPMVRDDGPVLQAITTIRGLEERRAKLWGLDAPVRTSIEGDELVIRIAGVNTDDV